jgi:hypothetical protein
VSCAAVAWHKAEDELLDDINEEDASQAIRELRSRGELDDLTEKVDNILGYRKEIDHALERIGAIEKHLGLDSRMSA